MRKSKTQLLVLVGARAALRTLRRGDDVAPVEPQPAAAPTSAAAAENVERLVDAGALLSRSRAALLRGRSERAADARARLLPHADLAEFGALALAVDLGDCLTREHLLQACRAAAARRGGAPDHQHYNGRLGYEVGMRAIDTRAWVRLLPRGLEELLAGYLGARPAVVSVSVIAVQPGAAPQDLHRDHGLGPFESVTLSLALEPGEFVTTLVAAGSHLTDEVDSARHALLRTEQPCALRRSNALLMDNYVVHGGAARAAMAGVADGAAGVASASGGGGDRGGEALDRGGGGGSGAAATCTGPEKTHIRRLFITIEKEEPERGSKAWATWSEVRKQHGHEGFAALSIRALRRDS